MKKKRILFIIGSLDIGGSEKQLLKVIDYLKEDFEISIYIIQPLKKVEEFLEL